MNNCQQGYYRAAHALARTARQMSRQLWKPATEADGLPFDILYTFFKALTEWRDDYLRAVGVPSNENQTWDFVTVSRQINVFFKTAHPS